MTRNSINIQHVSKTHRALFSKAFPLTHDGCKDGAEMALEAMRNFKGASHASVDVTILDASDTDSVLSMIVLNRIAFEHPGTTHIAVFCEVDSDAEAMSCVQLGNVTLAAARAGRGAARLSLWIDARVAGPPDISDRFICFDMTGEGVAELFVLVPVAVLRSILHILTGHRPRALHQLTIALIDQDAPLECDFLLPESLTGLQNVTIPETMVDCLSSLTSPLYSLGLISGRHAENTAVFLPSGCLGPNTMFHGRMFVQPPQPERLCSIRYSSDRSVAQALGWRSNLLDLRASRATHVHCDALALVVGDDNDELPVLTGASELLIARVITSRPGIIPEAFERARKAYPQARVLQSTTHLGGRRTLFIDDCIPQDPEQLLAVAMGLSTVDGDNDELTRCNAVMIQHVLDARRADGTVDEARMAGLMKLVNLLASDIVTMAEVGLA